MDSPLKIFPIPSPYNPPTISFLYHISMEWASPMLWRFLYATFISGVIQVPSCPGLGVFWHWSIVKSKCRSTVTLKMGLLRYLLIDLGTWTRPVFRTKRSGGNHHIRGSPALYHGKMPNLYARII